MGVVMRKRFQRFYDHDSKDVNVSKGFIANLQESCISMCTMNILVENSAVFRPCAHRMIELNGYAHFEFAEPRSKFEELMSGFKH